jgi:DNA-binding transcriptional LysR family regulator
MFTLRLFCDVASQRSFSAAALRHDITQSAASQRIGHLEKQLGVTLIDRSVRPLALTAAGELFHAEAKELVQRYDRLTHRLSQMSRQDGGLRGEVVVEAIYSAGIDLLNLIKEEFEELKPRVTVKIDYKRPEEVYDAVSHQRCDLGILSYPQRWRDVEVIPLRDERMCVACAPGHPLSSRKSVRASQLGDWEMATFEAELPAGRAIRRYLRDEGVEPHIVSVFDNIDTIKAAVAVTEQIAILPKRTIKREVAAGSLAAVTLEPELVRPMGIILPKRSRGATLSPAAQAFVDYLLEHAGPDADATNGTELATIK